MRLPQSMPLFKKFPDPNGKIKLFNVDHISYMGYEDLGSKISFSIYLISKKQLKTIFKNMAEVETYIRYLSIPY